MRRVPEENVRVSMKTRLMRNYMKSKAFASHDHTALGAG